MKQDSKVNNIIKV